MDLLFQRDLRLFVLLILSYAITGSLNWFPKYIFVQDSEYDRGGHFDSFFSSEIAAYVTHLPD